MSMQIKIKNGRYITCNDDVKSFEHNHNTHPDRKWVDEQISRTNPLTVGSKVTVSKHLDADSIVREITEIKMNRNFSSGYEVFIEPKNVYSGDKTRIMESIDLWNLYPIESTVVAEKNNERSAS